MVALGAATGGKLHCLDLSQKCIWFWWCYEARGCLCTEEQKAEIVLPYRAKNVC